MTESVERSISNDDNDVLEGATKTYEHHIVD